MTRNPEAGLGTTNRSRYSNPKMDELVKEASSTMDDAKRADLLARASNIAMDDYAMLPVHFELSVWAEGRHPLPGPARPGHPRAVRHPEEVTRIAGGFTCWRLS